MRRLDASWWTSLMFFVAALAFSAATTVWLLQRSEARYSELFQMMVAPRSAPAVPLPARPAPRAWSI